LPRVFFVKIYILHRMSNAKEGEMECIVPGFVKVPLALMGALSGLMGRSAT
jgi:hypothetical protein